MLDGEFPERMNKIWGIAVPIRNSGRRKWPEELRAMAVDRIAAGEGIREIAEEIGANKSLVALWVKNAKHDDAMPAFFEVVPPANAQLGREQGVMVAATDVAPICRIRIGDADIAIPPGYPADHLAEILRAVRAAQ